MPHFSAIQGVPGLRFFWSLRTWWIVAGYGVFAGLWIVFSDRALAVLVVDPEARMNWSVYKGLAFVLVTSCLLFLLVRTTFGEIESGYHRLQLHKRELERTQRL